MPQKSGAQIVQRSHLQISISSCLAVWQLPNVSCIGHDQARLVAAFLLAVSPKGILGFGFQPNSEQVRMLAISHGCQKL